MNSGTQRLFLESAVITAPVTRKWAEVTVCASSTKQSLFIFAVLELSNSWHTVGTQETFVRIKIERMDHCLKELAVEFGK